ncbi:hypothetical protein CONLIGDRAFT_45099 [Coniochaeta ligniaria NRRL 30616]|uniref:DUF3074 domain-containing protein n=1 Tax=Coniochaeta ligniaria NRRL 30616 TaxID=1408157 RepID=A0A1J7JYF9_9PEZI|nr:hypothetical protein CONLIGDRAFT_45099 [Coniochaeta ligniaria NRRL 30616]
MSTDPSFGPLIRLWGIKRAQLPPPTATPDLLTPFLAALLREALPFIDSVSPKSPSSVPSPSPSPSPSPWKPKSTKSFPTSTAPIRLLERRIPARLLAPAAAATLSPKPPLADEEVWACRLSVHEDAAADGTASWAEFREAMKEAHAESEEAFTPTVVAARRAVSWDCGAVAPVAVAGEKWGRFTLCIEEMRHAVGRPVLKDRVFAVLQMSASLVKEGGGEGEEFVVVSVTVSDFGEAPEAELARRGDVVVASYASVERVRKVEGEGEGGKIEWIMATASDARGVLPMWVQTRAVPGQIAKDVGLFLGWVREGRRKGEATGREGEDGEDGRHRAVDASAHGSVVAREQKALRKGMGSAGTSLQ